MKVAGRIPADQVVDARVWELPSWDGANKKFKVQKRKATRFTHEERRVRKRSTPSATPGSAQPESLEAQPELVSDRPAVQPAHA